MSLFQSLPLAVLFFLALWHCDFTAEAVNNEEADTTVLSDTALKAITSVEKDTVSLNELIRSITVITVTDSVEQITHIESITKQGETERDSSVRTETLSTHKDTVITVDTTAWPLDTIKAASGLAQGNGFILLTNRDTSLAGTFVIDGSKDSIIGFLRSPKGLPPNSPAMLNDSILIVSNTDYKDGSIGWANIRTGEKNLDYESIDPDAHVITQNSRAYLLERTNGIITGFAINDGETGNKKKENIFLNMNTGASSNPHGIAVWEAEKAFITRYGSSRLLIANPVEIDGGDTSTLDLGRYVAGYGTDSASKVPHMSSIHVHGKNAFIALQRLSGFQAVEKGLIIVINAETSSVVKEIELKYRNPYHTSTWGKFLFISCVENWGTKNGGIEKIDMEAMASAGIVAEESALGGDVSAFVAVSDKKGYAIVGNWPVNTVKPVEIP